MSSPKKKITVADQKQARYRRRQLLLHLISRLNKVISPLIDPKGVLWEPNGEIFAVEEGPRGDRKTKQLGFYGQLFAKLPRSTRLRFTMFTLKETEPSAEEWRRFEQEMLARARQILMRGIVSRVKALPHLTGRKRGMTQSERQNIRDAVLRVAKKEGSKTKAVRAVAHDLDRTERQVWRMISRNRKMKITTGGP